MQIRRTAAALTSAAALSVTGIAMASPATAAPNNTVQEGLVNVSATDTTVQVPIALAANICGLAVNVLAEQLAAGNVDCTADGVAVADDPDNGGPNTTTQSGLVNVSLTDTTVQIPIAVAANVCGVAVNVLARQDARGDAACDAIADSDANA